MRFFLFLLIITLPFSITSQIYETESINPINNKFLLESHETAVLGLNDRPIEENLPVYTFSLDFDPGSKRVSGVLEFDFYNNRNVSFSQLYFHLWPEAPLLNDPAALRINEITDKNGVALNYATLYDTNLIVDLPETVEFNERLSIFIEFTAFLPYAADRFGWYDSPFTIYNFGNWYPQLSVYENGEWDTSPYVYGGEAFYSEVAIYDVTLITPATLIAAASGDLIRNESINNSQWLWRWKTAPVRDFFFSLSPDFQVATRKYQNTTISSYFQPSHQLYGNLVLDIVEEDLYIFGDLFEPYPYSTLSVVETPARFGGMEYPNIVLIAASFYLSKDGNTDGLRDVVSHEVAHNWFAYLVGSDSYAEPWLDEAFAMYCGSYLYFEFTGRQSTAVSNLRLYQQAVVNTIRAGLDYKLNQSMAWWDSWAYDPPVTTGYGTFIYLKGMTVVHMLRQVLGNITFFDGMQAYFDEWAYKNAHIVDFIAVIEETAGYDLSWFFNEWLDTAGLPDYYFTQPRAIIYPDKTVIYVKIYQNQFTPFIMPLDVRIIIENRSNPFETVVWINESIQLITIEIMKGEIPSLITLDPHGWVLHLGGDLTAAVEMDFSSSRSTQSNNSSVLPAFDVGALIFFITVLFPIFIRFRRKALLSTITDDAPSFPHSN